MDGERDNGNGSLMRILPLAFIKDIDYETIENISSLTHRHKRSRIACVLYVEIAKSMINTPDLALKHMLKMQVIKLRSIMKAMQNLNTLEESLIMIIQKEFQAKAM